MHRRMVLALIAALAFMAVLFPLAAVCSDEPKETPETRFIVSDQPGKYEIMMNYIVQIGFVKITTTVESIEVLEDLSLKFNMVWSVKSFLTNVTKHSDKKNKKMYVMDDKGNRYDHFAGEGNAYQNATITPFASISGAFFFPPLSADCGSITFYDDDNNKTIGPIKVQQKLSTQH